MIKKLMRCTRCNQVLPVPDEWGDFGDRSVLPGVEWSGEDQARRQEFFRIHGEHLHEELQVDPESIFSESPFFEPIKVTYFEASNGVNKFLIKKVRDRFDRPASYELVNGEMRISIQSVGIQEEDLRRQIAIDLPPCLLPEEKVEKFIELLKDEVRRITLNGPSLEIGAILEGDSSLLGYGALRETQWEKIFEECAEEFATSELAAMRRFIQENRQPGDVLSLRIRRKMTVSPLKRIPPSADGPFPSLPPSSGIPFSEIG